MVPGWLGRLVRMHMVMTRSFVTRLGMRWLAVVHDSAVLEDDRVAKGLEPAGTENKLDRGEVDELHESLSKQLKAGRKG